MNPLIRALLVLLLYLGHHHSAAAIDPATQLSHWYTQVETYAYTAPAPALGYLDSIYTLAAAQGWWHYCFDAQLRRVNVASRHMLLDENRRFLDQLDSLGAVQDSFIRAYYLDHPGLEAMLRRGNYAFKTGQYPQALKAFETIVSQLHPIEAPSHREAVLLASALRYIGAIHQHWGEYSAALEAFGQALALAQQIATQDPVEARIPHTYKLLGDVYRHTAQWEAAEAAYRNALAGHTEALASATDKGPYYNRMRAAENSLVRLLIRRGQTRAALEVLQSSRIATPPGSAYAATRQALLARTLFAAGDIAAAQPHIEEAISLLTAVYDAQHPEIAEARHFQARLALEQNDWATALNYTREAITALPSDISLHPRQRLALLSLQQEVLARMALRSPDPTALQAAQKATETAVDFIDQLRQRYQQAPDKTRLLALSQGILHRGLAIYAQAFQRTQDEVALNAGFRLAEKSKGLVLLEAWQKARISRYAEIPDSLLIREAHLAAERQAMAEALASGGSTSEIAHKDLALQAVIAQEEALKAYIAVEFPAYFGLKYAQEGPDLRQVQRELLAPDQALLSYVWAGDTLHLFGISTRGVIWNIIPDAQAIDSLVQVSRQGLTQLLETDRSAEAFQAGQNRIQAAGYQLWQALIQPAEAGLVLPKRLVISPDGPLNRLPFGAMNRQPQAEWPDDPAQAPYLIQDYAFSYTYSAALWAEMRDRPKRRKSQGWLGFAPQFSPGQGLNQLFYSAGEVNGILADMAGKGVLGAEATRARFLEMAPYFQYLHLATHGKAPDANGPGFLAFAADSQAGEEGLLYLEDIYQMRLDAEMVVLSACETGLGEWQPGEGVMSLARGFAYAHAQSVIPSLWTIDGAASSALMQAFYAALREGQPKDIALQQAQQQMLAKGQAYGSHPFYWAAFLPIGDMAPLRGQGLPFWTWGLLLVGIAGIMMWRRKGKH